MKTLKLLILAFAASSLMGCDQSAVSRVPSEEEIEAGKERRLAEIEKLNIPEAQKERMRQQISGDLQRPNEDMDRR
jgi:hypothetical protein